MSLWRVRIRRCACLHRRFRSVGNQASHECGSRSRERAALRNSAKTRCNRRRRRSVSRAGLDNGSLQPDCYQGGFLRRIRGSDHNSGLRNVTLSSMVGVWLSGSTNNFALDNVSGVYASASSGNTFAIRKGTGGGLLFYAAQTGPATYIRNVNTQSPGAVIIGGQWVSRAGISGLGSMGGYDVARGGAARSGNYSSLVVDGIKQAPYVNGPNPPTNSYSAQLDTFFERYVWKTQNSPLVNVDAPNGTGACMGTQPLSIRQADTSYGASGKGNWFYQCYRGVSDMLFVGIPRVASLSTAVDLRHLVQGGGYRPAVLAALDQSRVEELTFALEKAYVDPYVPTVLARSLGYVELPDLSKAIGDAPSIILQNFRLPLTSRGFVSQYSLTQGAVSNTTNACVWGISGLVNRC